MGMIPVYNKSHEDITLEDFIEEESPDWAMCDHSYKFPGFIGIEYSEDGYKVDPSIRAVCLMGTRLDVNQNCSLFYFQEAEEIDLLITQLNKAKAFLNREITYQQAVDNVL